MILVEPMDDPDPITLSALQHWAYCPRQCGLIHLEQAFDDNLQTQRGQAVQAIQPRLQRRARFTARAWIETSYDDAAPARLASRAWIETITC